MSDNVINLDEKRAALKEAEDDDVLAVITIKASSRVTSWVSDRVETGEQWNWLYGHAATAISQLVEMEGAKVTYPDSGA